MSTREEFTPYEVEYYNSRLDRVVFVVIAVKSLEDLRGLVDDRACGPFKFTKLHRPAVK